MGDGGINDGNEKQTYYQRNREAVREQQKTYYRTNRKRLAAKGATALLAEEDGGTVPSRLKQKEPKGSSSPLARGPITVFRGVSLCVL